jgi:hypothetical protein
MQPMSVYVVTNRKNGKQYVGITSLAPEQRWQLHCSEAKSGGVRIFCRAIRKYGRDGFDWQVVSGVATPAIAAQIERSMIARLRPAYNMTAGGDGTAGLHPIARAKKANAIKASWENPDVRARRTAGLQAASKSVDRVTKGRRISAAKSRPDKVAKTREQAQSRVAADGGAQVRAAQASRWAKPGAREAWAERMRARYQDPEWRAKASEYASRRVYKKVGQ